MKRIAAVLIALFIIAVVVANGYWFVPATALALGGKCGEDPHNLIVNGNMAPGGSSTWGPTAAYWNAFVLSGSPSFDWVNNEGWDSAGSQFIQGTEPFDAGIYQTVSNLEPGVYYHFWVGYALAAYDAGSGSNQRYDQIGRMIGIDPTGGSDPTSPNVVWGPEARDGVRALNIPAMGRVFATQTGRATFFIRGTNHSAQYLNKLWFDSVCMEPSGGMPTATPGPSVTPTLTASPTLAPTEVPHVVAQAATPRPSATRVPPTPTFTPTLVPTNTPTITKTPTETPIPTDTPRPRRAIPLTSAGAGSDATGADASDGPAPRSFDSGMIVLIGSVGLIGVSGLGILSLGAFVALRLLAHPSPRAVRRY